MSFCNDLLGLGYGWGCRPGDGSGRTDCFQLMGEIHRRLGVRDYREVFAWVYRAYPPETVPSIRLVRWLLENSDHVETPQPGDVGILKGPIGGAFATVSDTCGLVYLNNSGVVVHAPKVPSNLRLYRPLP